MRKRFGGLWRNGDFLRFWAGETVSLFGTQITAFALPLVAANTMRATPTQMGTLGFVQYVPWLLVGVFAGVWIDRLRRRPIMLATDLLRLALLGSIPLAALWNVLRIEQLYVVGFLVGVCNVFFEVAYNAFLPALVERDQLVEGNSKLQASAAASEVAGPGLAGVLTQATSASFAIVVDALSFLVSALALVRMRGHEAPPAISNKSSSDLRPTTNDAQGAPGPTETDGVNDTASEDHGHSFLHDARVGLRLVVTHRLLRGFTGCSTMGNTAINIHLAVYVLYLTRELDMQPAAIGLLYALAGAGGLLGASLAPRLSRALGAGRTTSLSQLAHGVCLTALPLAGLLGGLALPLMGLFHFVWGLTMTTYTIPAVSLRQAITPDRLQGRIIASQRVLTFGVSPIGFLIGGALGEWAGIWPTLVIAGVGLLLSNLWLSLSPLPGVRDAESLPRELAIVEPSVA